MAHKKAGGSTHLGRDSQPQYLGTKVYGGQYVTSGSIIIRQRGTTIHPGKNVKKGKDDTLFATADGLIKFTKRKRMRFDGKVKMTKFANVIPVSTPSSPKRSLPGKQTGRASKPTAKQAE